MPVFESRRIRRSLLPIGAAASALIWAVGVPSAPASATALALHHYSFEESTPGAELDNADLDVLGGPGGRWELDGHLQDTACDGKTPIVTVTDWVGNPLKSQQDHTGCGGGGTYFAMVGNQSTPGVHVITCVIGRGCSESKAFWG